MKLTDEQLRFFSKFIESQIGIVYSDSNLYQLEGRLEAVAKALGLSNTNELWVRAASGFDITLKKLLLDTATNNETSFFRDKSLFKAVETLAGQGLLGTSSISGTRQIRVWSACCSTGQEPYSIAIALSEVLAKTPNAFTFQILASDYSDRALTQARSGVYSQLEVQRGLPITLLMKYFEQVGTADEWKVRDQLRSRINFDNFNLLEPWSFVGKFDLIFLRNVLIYQSVENKKVVIQKIQSYLNEGGHFALGAAESLMGLSDSFDQIQSEGSILYKLKA
jgi:chemotaxis protein methyltransferase CheR